MAAVGILLVGGVAPAWGQGAVGGETPVVLIDAPKEASEHPRTPPVEPAGEATSLPTVAVAAGLVLLGVTLARISLRRRAELALGVETDAVAPKVLVLRSSHIYVKGTPAPDRPTAMPRSASSG